ncbi:MAG: hypothetical protein ACTH2Q_17310 [Propionibacteriaceae bacterium]
MTLELFRVPLGAGADSDLIIDFATVERDFLVATLGDDDLADGPKSVAVVWANQRYVTKVWFVARQEGRPVGAASARLPLTDNKTLAEMEMTVTAGADHDVVADALWGAVRPELVRAGRSTVQCWAAHALDGPNANAPSEDWLRPATGVGALPPDPFALWLRNRGFRLEQAERHSVLDVGPALPIAAELAAARPHSADAYEVISWRGATPDAYQEPMAVLRSRMSVDVPTAALEAEEEVWDAERVRVDDEASLARGMDVCTTVARHRDSGDLVAYSVLLQPTDKPAVAYQEDTLVHGEHRGHRLGMMVKAANLQTLHDHAPEVERVHTWNAGENSWMLDINVAMGFTERSAESAWQLTGLE